MTVGGIKENDGRGVNLTKIYCKHFVNVTMYPQNNNNNNKKETRVPYNKIERQRYQFFILFYFLSCFGHYFSLYQSLTQHLAPSRSPVNLYWVRTPGSGLCSLAGVAESKHRKRKPTVVVWGTSVKPWLICMSALCPRSWVTASPHWHIATGPFTIMT
jgi:hypothetical protein